MSQVGGVWIMLHGGNNLVAQFVLNFISVVLLEVEIRALCHDKRDYYLFSLFLQVLLADMQE